MKTIPLLPTFLSVALVLHAQDAALVQRLEAGFSAFDADKDGSLNEAEFKALGEYSPKLKGKPQVVDYLLRELDANHDCKLSRTEYMGIATITPRQNGPPANPPSQTSADNPAWTPG